MSLPDFNWVPQLGGWHQVVVVLGVLAFLLVKHFRANPELLVFRDFAQNLNTTITEALSRVEQQLNLQSASLLSVDHELKEIRRILAEVAGGGSRP